MHIKGGLTPLLSDAQYRWLGRIVLAISIGMCIVLFVQDRSLLLDSLNVARNIGERSFWQLISPLSYEQSAPLLFLWISKLITSIFGISHYTLRVLPLIAAVGSLFLFLDIGRKLFAKPYVYIALFWLGTHQLFARYATEYKQYMIDLFAALIIIWMVMRIQKFDKGKWWKFALVSSIIVWLSMPSIFVIITSMVYIGIVRIKASNIKFLIFAGAFISISFIANYYVMLLPTIGSDHMQNFHDNFFLEGRFWNKSSLNHDLGLIIGQVRMIVGKSGVAIAAFLLLIMISIVNGWKKRQYEVILLLLPVVGAFSASLLGMYSILERLMLFALPLYILSACKGLEVVVGLWDSKQKYIVRISSGIIALGLVIGFVDRQSFKYIIEPFEHEDNRSSLLSIVNDPSYDKSVVCTQHAVPAYDYYTKYDEDYKTLNIGDAIRTSYGDDVVEVALTRLRSEGAVWVLANHYPEKDIDNLIQDFGGRCKIKKSYRSKRSIALFLIGM